MVEWVQDPRAASFTDVTNLSVQNAQYFSVTERVGALGVIVMEGAILVQQHDVALFRIEVDDVFVPSGIVGRIFDAHDFMGV